VTMKAEDLQTLILQGTLPVASPYHSRSFSRVLSSCLERANGAPIQGKWLVLRREEQLFLFFPSKEFHRFRQYSYAVG
jgi:hypothetical protein